MSLQSFPSNKKEMILSEICRVLKRTNAIEFGTFRLPGGKITPYYIDLRVIPSFPDAFAKIIEIFVDAVKSEIGVENFDRVAGIPTAGLPLSAITAYILKKPFIYIRQKQKLKGRERRVEGVIMPGDRILLVDDMVMTGLSLVRSTLAVRAEGGLVTDAFVLFDREEGGERRLAKIGVKLHAVLGASEVARKLYEMNIIEEDKMKIIISQVKKAKK
ncbi:MAG: phosphoribosyltransferase family protein [Candidatus Bathyarchaeia archaeon]|nr:orotate phosphoribosyltransferase [Candidatus Bathyarchaeota archaeon]